MKKGEGISQEGKGDGEGKAEEEGGARLQYSSRERSHGSEHHSGRTVQLKRGNDDEFAG